MMVSLVLFGGPLMFGVVDRTSYHGYTYQLFGSLARLRS